jgi:hypothetical protein
MITHRSCSFNSLSIKWFEMGRTASNVWLSSSLLIILGLGLLWLTGGRVRHVVRFHAGANYYLVEDYNGATYITRTPQRDYSINQYFESPNGGFTGIETTSIYWRAVTFGIPYWLVMLALSILPIRKAWEIFTTFPRLAQRAIAVVALIALTVFLCLFLTPHLN